MKQPRWAPVFGIAAALALLALGLAAGQDLDVLRKAAAICLECIGVG